ncbi:MAG TPA: radical SAM protein [Allosphingosinicella sp.]
MRVCLIQVPPASEADKHWARFPILGLAYVAAAIERAGHEVILLDGKLDELSEDEIVERAAAARADLIGFTCMTVEFPSVVRVAGRLKPLCEAPIIAGGAHVNAVGAQALEDCAHLDLVCKGEGEDLILELIEAIEGRASLADIPGLSYREGGAVVSNPTRPYPKDYDRLAYPAWHLFRVGEEIPVLTHRGCPYRCTFCGHNSGFKARFRSVDNVLDEISQVVARFEPSVIRFEDETFGLDLKRTKAILAGIMERGLHRKVSFSAQTRVDRADGEFMAMLRDANFKTLELGVETGNAEVMKRIRKGITLEQVEAAVALAKREGLRVWCKFIIGHPHETRATAMDTVRFITKLNPHQLSVSIMTPFPGTPIHDMAMKGEGGYRVLTDDWSAFDKYSTGALELVELPLHRLKMLQLLCYLSLYLRNGRLIELVKLVVAHRALAVQLALGPLRSFRSRTRAAPQPVAAE